MEKAPLLSSFLGLIKRVFSFVLISACTKDIGKLPYCESHPHHYSSEIREIISQKCATGNCHSENFPFGNFHSYADVKSKVDKGTFKSFVFDYSLMPPTGSEQLSSEELQRINCWLQEGALDD
jgi:hypothetical protein